MVSVQEQYDAYPYPERNPEDERKRLISGSPSHPQEVDHFLFEGKRDWSKPFRVLVAGGGTGDGLIQIAQLTAQAKCPAEITYIDLSPKAREVAEARAKVRGLDNITFVTGSLLDAPEMGSFDYIDCCGVLHHLPDPEAGFRALRAALAPGGGLGFMVYAPHGRSGVYPLQDAFAQLYQGLSAEDRLKKAKTVVKGLSKAHAFAANTLVNDHKTSDAGFYDLLLHGQDRAYDVPDLLEVLAATGWRLQSFCTPALYDLSLITDRPDGMRDDVAWGIAEKLRGTLKVHVAYAVPDDETRKIARGTDRALIPHLRGVPAKGLAQAVAQGRKVPLKLAGVETVLNLPQASAPLIAAIDSRNTLKKIAQIAGMDPLSAGPLWSLVERELAPWGLLIYSKLSLV